MNDAFSHSPRDTVCKPEVKCLQALAAVSSFGYCDVSLPSNWSSAAA
jgi:hypothetical protein